MRPLYFTIYLLFITFNIFGQKNLNPDNKLDLKVVYQNYTIETKYSSEKAKYLLLKVNDEYLKDGYTGIDKVTFKSYLAKCPKALNKVNLGLNEFKKSSRVEWIGYGGSTLLAFLAYTSYIKYDMDKTKKSNLYGAIGFGTGALGSMVYSWIKSSDYNKKGNKSIIDGFDLYNKSCYVKPLQDTLPKAKSQTKVNKVDITGNGESNENEGVDINVINNDNSKPIFALVGALNCGLTNGFFVAGKIKPFYYKKGLTVSGYYNYNVIDELVIDGDEGVSYPKRFRYGADLTIPLSTKDKMISNDLYLGISNGIKFFAKTKIKTFLSWGVDLGISNNRAFVTRDEDVNSFSGITENSIIHFGPSFTFSNNVHYKVNDDRFNIEKNYKSWARPYIRGLYALNNKISDVNLIVQPNVKTSNIGIVAGFEFLRLKKNFGFNAGLSVGLYPGLPKNYGGEFIIGFAIGK